MYVHVCHCCYFMITLYKGLSIVYQYNSYSKQSQGKFNPVCINVLLNTFTLVRFHPSFQNIHVVNNRWYQVAIWWSVALTLVGLCELVSRMNNQRIRYGTDDKCSSEWQIFYQTHTALSTGSHWNLRNVNKHEGSCIHSSSAIIWVHLIYHWQLTQFVMT